MGQYRRFLIYRRNTLVAQTQLVGKTLTIEWDIQGFVGKTLQLLYDILTVDARSLWEPKTPGQAAWEVAPAKDPTYRPIESTSDTAVSDAILDELGDYLLTEGGDYLLLE